MRVRDFHHWEVRRDVLRQFVFGATLSVAVISWIGVVGLADASGPRAQKVDITGLPHRSVLALLEDREGFLWIGTVDGLARFDGYTTIVFRHDPFDSDCLSNSTVTTLLEDRRGDLWVGTESGLHILNRKRNTFRRIVLPGVNQTNGVEVSCVLEDRTGRVWVGTRRSGLFRFEPDRGRIDHFLHRIGTPESLLHDDVRGIQEDAAGDVWVMACGVDGCGLQRSSSPNEFQTVAPRVGGTATWTLAIDRSNNVWTDPCDPLGPAAGAAFNPEGSVCGGGVETWAIEPLANGQIWFGTSTGLFKTDSPFSAASQVEIENSPGSFLSSIVRSVHRGYSGIIWVGTHGGLYAVDPHAKRFNHADLWFEERHGNQTAAAVSSVVEGPEGDLFVGTFGAGIIRVDRSGTVVDHFRSDSTPGQAVKSDVIWSMQPDGQGDLWIAGDGLARLDLQTGLLTEYSLPHGYEPRFVLPDGSGQLWLAGYRGVARFDPETREHSTIAIDPHLESVAGGVQTLCLQGEETLWIGSVDTLYRLDVGSGAVEQFPLQTHDGISLRGTGTWTIHLDTAGRLWLGTSIGLLLFEQESRSFSVFSTRDGLPGSSVYSILEDDAGRLWLGTNQGLSRFDPAATQDRFRTYTMDDGIGNVEFNRHAALKTRDGALVFGGLDGLTWFNPWEIHDNPAIPPVRLTRIDVLGKNGTRHINPYGLKRLVLSSRDVTLGVEFSALSYTNAGQNQYAYRLDGLDPDWVEAGSRRFAQYTRVPPGDYLFRVRGSNNDGVWNEDGLTLPIIIRPAYWQTVWFRISVVVLIALGLLAGYSYRKTKARELQQLRLQIAGDLHDDLASDLSGIGVVADLLQRQPNLDGRQREDVTIIRDTAGRMVDGLRDIVWYIDPEHDTFEATVDRMRSFAERLLRGMQHHVSATVPKRSPNLPMEVRRDIFLIFKETLQNIVRHAHAERVEVELEVNQGRLRLVVTDDGIGFDPKTETPGHGMRSMQRRADQLGATLEIASRTGEGARISLTVDLARFRDGVPLRRDLP